MTSNMSSLRKLIFQIMLMILNLLEALFILYVNWSLSSYFLATFITEVSVSPSWDPSLSHSDSTFFLFFFSVSFVVSFHMSCTCLPLWEFGLDSFLVSFYILLIDNLMNILDFIHHLWVNGFKNLYFQFEASIATYIRKSLPVSETSQIYLSLSVFPYFINIVAKTMNVYNVWEFCSLPG